MGWECTALASLLAASVASASVEYRIDDGASELGVGFPMMIPPGYAGDLSMTVINGFTAVAGGERITEVSMISPAAGVAGTLTAYVWSGGATPMNATGAVLESSATITLPASGQSIAIDVPDVDFTAGDVFFVGMQITYTNAGGPSVLFGLLDRDGIDNGFSFGLQNASFISSAFGGPQNHAVLNAGPVSTGVGFNGNWILRATGEPIPAPAALIPAAGFLALGRRRR